METLAKVTQNALKIYIYGLSADTYSPLGQLVIKNHGGKPLRIDRDLANFLGVGRGVNNIIGTDWLLSKALADNQISDSEFQISSNALLHDFLHDFRSGRLKKDDQPKHLYIRQKAAMTGKKEWACLQTHSHCQCL